MNLRKVLLPVIALTASLFVSCGTNVPNNSDPLDRARSVPKVAGQAISLLQSVQRGVRAREDMYFGSIATEDFHGRAFTYVNFMVPFAIDDPWSVTPSDLESKDDAIVTVVTGASTGRSVAYALGHDLSLLKELQATTIAMGGKQNVKRVVSLQGGFDLFLESTTGQYWIVSSNPKQATEAQITTWIDQETQARQTLSKETKLYEKVEQQWDELLDPNTPKNRTATLKIADFTKTNGNLNLAKAVRVTQARGFDTGTQVDSVHKSTRVITGTGAECWWFLWWQVCDSVTYGALSNSKVPGGGYGQYASDYGISPDWDVSGGKLLSCGTEAFVSMAWWWQYRNVPFYKIASKPESPIYYRVFNPNDPNKVTYHGNDALSYIYYDSTTGTYKTEYTKKWSSDSFAQRMVKLDAYRRPEIAN